MIVRTNNGYPSLTADGKIRECCCGCLDVQFSVLCVERVGQVYNATGSHTMNAVIDTASTKCGALSFSITNDTAAELTSRSVQQISCDGPCGTARLAKEQGLVLGRIRYPGPANGDAFLLEYKCNRFYTYSTMPGYGFKFGGISVSGLPGGIQLRAQYRVGGSSPDTRVFLDISQDGTYAADPVGMVIGEPGTPTGNSPVYAEIFFT